MFRSLFLQAIGFSALFLLISWFQTLELLDTSGTTQAPEIRLKATNDETIDLKQFQGKTTLVYFWAPWCTVCKLSMPNLQSFHENYGEKVNVVAVALSYESEDEVKQYMLDKAYSFPSLLGNHQISQEYKIKGFPTYYVLDEQGKVVSKSMGYSTELGIMLRSLI